MRGNGPYRFTIRPGIRRGFRGEPGNIKIVSGEDAGTYFDITPPLPGPPGLLARTNHKCAVWAIGLLDIKPNDKALEVGFGPGLGIQFAAGLTSRDMWLASIR